MYRIVPYRISEYGFLKYRIFKYRFSWYLNMSNKMINENLSKTKIFCILIKFSVQTFNGG